MTDPKTATTLPHDEDHAEIVICSHVHEGTRPARFAIREREDGILQILCGEWDHDEEESAQLACAHCLLERDANLAAVLDLPPGFMAEWDDEASEWIIDEYEDEDEEVA